MKNKQIISILLVFVTVMTVFCSCKSNEPEFIPDTPEITLSTDTGESDTNKPTLLVSEPSDSEAVDATVKTPDKTTKKEETATTKKSN